MRCPVDDETLQMTERSGVEIDYCPRCRGVWLDRGELDKILDRAERELAPPSPYRDDDAGRRRDDDVGWRRDADAGRRRDDDAGRRRDDDRDDRRRQEFGDRPKKKRKSFLSEMLEFGD